jgi:hypothetical protein
MSNRSHQSSVPGPRSSADKVSRVLTDFTEWLDAYGEKSWDYQSFFAGPVGGRAKALYYRSRFIGTAAVAPMIFCEAFLPAGRRLFHHPIRFPIADAHYAMGFAFLYELTADLRHLERAIHFLDELMKSRCPGFAEYCWGYPFDWVWLRGTIQRQTPLITTTPYVYEAFLQVYETLGHTSEFRPLTSDLRPLDLLGDYKQILESIARHAASDIKDFRTSETASSCSYTPFAGDGVVNAATYRAFLLTSASKVLSNEDYHFHTCFVMKALTKINALTGYKACEGALARGVEYYLKNLFDQDGLPKPFSKAPRLTVYKRELYDCAECINLCLLLRDRFPQLEATLETVVRGILKDWIKRDGSFRSRRLHLGWDNVPMHRWGQAQMFRSLAFYLRESIKVRAHRDQPPAQRGLRPGGRSENSDEKAAPGNQLAEFIQK